MLFGLTDLFHTLDAYNRDRNYIRSRQKDFRKILTIATLVTVLSIMGFHYIELLLPWPTPNLLLTVRLIACLALLINLGLSYISRSPISIRFFVYSGFLIASVFASVLSAMSGGFESPYWYTISLVIIGWFIFIPVTYRFLILHSLVFITQFIIILSLTDQHNTTYPETIFQMFSLAGIFIVGSIHAISSNLSSAKVYLNQQALSDSEAQYRFLVENANDGIVITRNNQFLFANNTFLNLTGYTMEELKEKTIFDLVRSEDHETMRKYHTRRMNGDYFSAIYSVTGITKSGKPLPMELNSSTIDYKGKPSAFIVIRDFTERENSQKALVESEARYRTIFNLAGDAIILMRYETGEIVDVNDAACKLYGYNREEFLTLSNPDISAEPEESIKILQENKGYVYIPNRLHKRKDSGRLNVEVMGNVFRLKDEDLAISVVHDLTEKKKLEEELEKSYAVLEKNYSHTLEQMQTYFAELQAKKSELLRMQKENLQSQFDTLKNQVNPHFLFNSLNILSSLISVNSDLAEEFTGNLSKIYRYILEHKSDDLVTLASEMEFLEAYCFLVNIRFEGKLKFNINIPKEVLQYKLPQLTIQILIENALKHNTFSAKSPLVINMFIDDEHYLHIENNNQPRENKIESTGVGLTNIANRYSFFTEKETSFGVVGDKFVARIPLL